MAGKNQHVVPHADGWAVKGAGNQRATSVPPDAGRSDGRRARDRDQQQL